jgi:hypothetical protein
MLAFFYRNFCCLSTFSHSGLDAFLCLSTTALITSITVLDHKMIIPHSCLCKLPLPDKKFSQVGIVVHICNPSIWETEAGGYLVWGQPGGVLHSETLSQKFFLCLSPWPPSQIISRSGPYWVFNNLVLHGTCMCVAYVWVLLKYLRWVRGSLICFSRSYYDYSYIFRSLFGLQNNVCFLGHWKSCWVMSVGILVSLFPASYWNYTNDGLMGRRVLALPKELMYIWGGWVGSRMFTSAFRGCEDMFVVVGVLKTLVFLPGRLNSFYWFQ